MRIGLVGKPNVGKSTFFSAATLAKVDIANYPFCTIEPNVGVAFIESPNECPCKELRKKLEADGRLPPVDETDERKGSICEPRTGSCVGFKRLVPTFLVDVAGLVPGASEGRGRGNAFLSDLANCNALIQVIDAAGTTDIEGNPISQLQDIRASIISEVNFLTSELDSWIFGLLNDGWSRASKKVQAEGEKGFSKFLLERFTGLGATMPQILQTLDAMRTNLGNIDTPWVWEEDKIRQLAVEIRRQLFPIHIAANKADSTNEQTWDVVDSDGLVQPTMADMELALRRADSAGIISYNSGDNDFIILNESNLNEAQSNALSTMKNKLARLGNTGVSKLISDVLFSALNHIVVYPVADESAWKDGDGKILPDAFVVPDLITAKSLAYKVHSDLGDGFIKAVDARTRRVVGADYECNDNDVIKIHSKN